MSLAAAAAAAANDAVALTTRCVYRLVPYRRSTNAALGCLRQIAITRGTYIYIVSVWMWMATRGKVEPDAEMKKLADSTAAEIFRNQAFDSLNEPERRRRQ